MRKAVEKHSRQLDPHNPRYGTHGYTILPLVLPEMVEYYSRFSQNDFIDEYLVKIRETSDPTSSFYQDKGAQNIEAVIGDLFLPGSETTNITLSFAMLYLILNKEAQRNAQEELDRVVGCSLEASLSDKPTLPWVEAIVLETLRLSSITPLGAPHRMLADTVFHGYFLPKDVTVISGLYTIHHDPKIWGEDANEFRPERFLNEDKTSLIQNEALMPFSAGRRACIGEGLSKDTMFLFIASILKRFNIERDPENPVWEVEALSGFIVEPKPFKFVLSIRNG